MSWVHVDDVRKGRALAVERATLEERARILNLLEEHPMDNTLRQTLIALITGVSNG